jgi:molybdate transport system substrate-binding protein
MNAFAGITFLVVGLFSAPAVPAAEIHIFAAASLSDALKEVATGFEKQSGDRLVFNFGASSTLARQIIEGAPADLFFSADEARMDALEKQKLLVGGSRTRRLSNSLVIVGRVDGSVALRSAADLTNASVQRIALADPKAVPAGVYARAYLQELGLWVRIAPKVIPTENVRAALAAVETGNVEAGIVYKTDAAVSARVKVLYEVPRAVGPDISYPMALIQGSPQPAAARKCLDYLNSDAAGKVFEKFGFILQKRQ